MTNYINGKLFVEDVSFQALAENYGTPCYIYSYEYLINEFLKIIIIKINSNIKIKILPKINWLKISGVVTSVAIRK